MHQQHQLKILLLQMTSLNRSRVHWNKYQIRAEFLLGAFLNKYMLFERTVYKEGKPVKDTIDTTYDRINEAFSKRFDEDNTVFRWSKDQQENGKMIYDLQDKHHKIIIQLKEL